MWGEEFNNDENQDYLYGKLNKEVEQREYKGKKSNTINVTVDNSDNSIQADLLKTKGKLKIIKNYKPYTFDGSENVTLELHDLDTKDFVTKEEFEEKVPKKTNQLENNGDGTDNNSPFATQAWVNQHGVGGNPQYNGIINSSDWMKDGDGFYYYTIRQNIHNLLNPVCLSYLGKVNNGYENCIYSYKLLPDDSIRFKSSIRIDVKYKLEGEK